MRQESGMIRFEISYGGFKETHRAPTLHDAWLRFIDGKRIIVGTLASFREIPWNSQFTWEKKCAERKRGCWYYVNPAWFLSHEANQPQQSDVFRLGDLKDALTS
jgi:hypothetical protein